jgi:RimJ/RimL family protein N-acetyltransferase
MQPSIATDRLILRPFRSADAEEVQRMAGDYRVAEPTANVPHPYVDGAAEQWIASHSQSFQSRTSIVCAISLIGSGRLAGAIALSQISATHRRAELGYWIGFEHWSQGICSEAARALIQYASHEFGLTRFDCRCLARNLGSARVMEKAGFLLEGRLIKHVNHRGRYEDMLVYGLTLPARINSAAPA